MVPRRTWATGDALTESRRRHRRRRVPRRPAGRRTSSTHGHGDVRALVPQPTPRGSPSRPARRSTCSTDRHGLADGVRRASTPSCTSPAPTRSSPRTDPDRALAETRRARAATSARRAAAAGVARVVYVSTVHVYGAALAPGATIDEDVAPAAAVGLRRSPGSPSEHLARPSRSPTPSCCASPTRSAHRPHPDVDRWTLVAADLCRQRGRPPARSCCARPASSGATSSALADVCRRHRRRADAASGPGGHLQPRVGPSAHRAGSSPSWSRTGRGAAPARARRSSARRPASRDPAPYRRRHRPARRPRPRAPTRRSRTRSTRSSSSASTTAPTLARTRSRHERDRRARRHAAAAHRRRARRGVPHAARGQPELRALRRDLLLDGLPGRDQGAGTSTRR